MNEDLTLDLFLRAAQARQLGISGYKYDSEPFIQDQSMLERLERNYVKALEQAQTPEEKRVALEDLNDLEFAKKFIRPNPFEITTSLFSKTMMALEGLVPGYVNRRGENLFPIRLGRHGRTHYSVFNMKGVDPEDRFDTKFLVNLFIRSLRPILPETKKNPPFIQNLTILGDNYEIEKSIHLVDYAYASRVKFGVPIQYRNLFEDNFSFIIESYAKRMSISHETLEELRKISVSLQQRSILLVSTKESHDVIHPESSVMTPFRGEWEQLPHFTITGSMTLVKSVSENEKLPLELFTGFDIERKYPEEHLLEIGRFAIDAKEANVSADEIIAAASAYSARVPGLSRIIIEADRVRARLFKSYGFKIIHERTNFAGEAEYIMNVTPSDLKQAVEKRSAIALD